MTTSLRRLAAALALSGLLAAALPGCASGRFSDSLQGVDRAALPHRSFQMTAERYDFDPEELHVEAGTLVTLTITSIDDVHGFDLPDWDIDVRLDPDTPVTVEFLAPEPGTYEFHCSHFCGMGHFGMNGRIVVEPR